LLLGLKYLFAPTPLLEIAQVLACLILGALDLASILFLVFPDLLLPATTSFFFRSFSFGLSCQTLVFEFSHSIVRHTFLVSCP
jgi:hypothetical protein